LTRYDAKISYKINIRDAIVEILRTARKFFKYRELEDVLELPAPVIWRYISGEVKPSVERAYEILDKVKKRKLIKEVLRRAVAKIDGDLINLYTIVYNIDLLKLAAVEAYIEFSNFNPSTILTVETDGIPLAVMTAAYMGTKIVVAKKRKEIGFEDYLEETYLAFDPPSLITLYVPHDVLEERDRVLIVDDVLRSGRTSKALVNLVYKANAEVIGIFALLAIGSRWRSQLEDITPKIHILYEIAQG